MAAKRGRPKTDPKTHKRVPLSFKTTEKLRAKLDKHAAESGRSLSAEVEYRLEKLDWFETYTIHKQDDWI